MPSSDFLANAVLQQYLRTSTAYVALLTAPLDSAGTLANEVVAGGNAYARKASVWDVPVSRRTFLTDALQWVNMPGVTVTHWALLTALTGGNVLWHAALSSPVILTAGEPLDIPARGLDVGYD